MYNTCIDADNLVFPFSDYNKCLDIKNGMFLCEKIEKYTSPEREIV